jgi:photosystem II stability/assembly factor-like uncharacterized protein
MAPTQTFQATPSPTLSVSTQPSPGATFSALAFFDADRGLLGGGVTVAGEDPTKGLLWRTVDGGSTWASIAYDGSPILNFATSGPNDVWAATGCLDGSCGAAILASVDAGRTWKTVSARLVQALSFIDAKHGWAVTESAPPDGGDLLETRDGGRTWTVLHRPCPIGVGIAVSFVTTDRGWLGCGALAGAGQEPKAVIETIDQARTWTVRAEAGIDASVGTISSLDYITGLAMRPSGAGFMWMTRGTTVRTSDAGRVWSPIPPGEFDVSLPFAAALVDDRTWFLLLWDGNVGVQKGMVTRDSGTTWHDLGRLPG